VTSAQGQIAVPGATSHETCGVQLANELISRSAFSAQGLLTVLAALELNAQSTDEPSALIASVHPLPAPEEDT
jgi:hypothetical protein